MDSSGRVHMMEIQEGLLPRHTGFVTRDPMPERCDARKVLSALDKIGSRPPGDAETDAALAPLTPFEKGYGLGVLAEYRGWKATQ